MATMEAWWMTCVWPLGVSGNELCITLSNKHGNYKMTSKISGNEHIGCIEMKGCIINTGPIKTSCQTYQLVLTPPMFDHFVQ